MNIINSSYKVNLRNGGNICNQVILCITRFFCYFIVLNQLITFVYHSGISVWEQIKLGLYILNVSKNIFEI